MEKNIKQEIENINEISDKEYENYLSDDALYDFLRLIRKYAPATTEENYRLFELYKNGDEQSRELIINKNLRLVIGIALKNKRKLRSYDKLDVIQDGIIGLITAIDKYDSSVSAFSTYAVYWIKQSIGRGIEDNDSMIRRPNNFIALRNRYNKIIDENLKNGKQLPNDKELLAILDTTKDILQLLKEDYKLEAKSLNQKIDDDEDSTIEQFVGFEETGYASLLDRIVDTELMVYLKDLLSHTDYYILYHRILSSEVKTLEEVGQSLGLSRERIRQKEEKIKRRLRNLYGNSRHLRGLKSSELQQSYDIEDIKIEPFEPKSIAKFLYLRDRCDDVERVVLKELYWSDRKNYSRYLSRTLSLNKDDTEKLVARVQEKAQSILDDETYHFEIFYENLIAAYGSKIFVVEEDVDISGLLKSPKYTLHIWENRTYGDFLEALEEKGRSVPTELEETIKDFFNVPRYARYHPSDLEVKINTLILELDRDDEIPKKKLYEFLIHNTDKFTDIQIEILLWRLGIISRKEITSKYPIEEFRSKTNYAINKLYTLYFGFKSYRNYNFNREKYLEVRPKCLLSMDEYMIKVLDNFYGYYTGIPLSQQELANSLGLNLLETKKVLRVAKMQAGNVHALISVNISLNLSIYKRFLQSNPIVFTSPTDKIVYGYFLESKTYEELARETGKSTLQISNCITDAIWKIDSHRFGLIPIFPYPKDLLLKVLETMNLSVELKQKIHDYIVGKCETFSSKTEKKDRSFYDSVKALYNYTKKYIKSTVTLTDEEIINFLCEPHYKNVLNEKELLYMSLLYGVKNDLNPFGIKQNIKLMAKDLGISKDILYKYISSAHEKLVMRKVGSLKNPLDLMDIDELENYVRDAHTPLSENDRNVLINIYGLFGQKAKTIRELSFLMDVRDTSIRRRILRAIIIIKRYQNKEIAPSVVFEYDVKPYLKYFSKSDQQVLILYFKDGLIVREIATRIGMTVNQTNVLLYKLRIYLNDLQKGESGFDFDYFWNTIYDDDVPLYGDKDLAISVFELYFEKRLGMLEIIKNYHPELGSESNVKGILNSIMIAIAKRREGIKKIRDFSYEEIREYYLVHQSEMCNSNKIFYYNYFKKIKSGYVATTCPVSRAIAYDLVKESSDFINIRNMSREEMRTFIKKYRDRLKEGEVRDLARIAKIPYREFMNGSDKKQVLEFLMSLEDYSIKNGNEKERRLRFSKNNIGFYQ